MFFKEKIKWESGKQDEEFLTISKIKIKVLQKLFHIQHPQRYFYCYLLLFVFVHRCATFVVRDALTILYFLLCLKNLKADCYHFWSEASLW